MRYLVKTAGFLVLLCATLSLAQTTNVTLQVTDVDGQTWNNGTWSVQLTSPPGVPCCNYKISGTSTAVPNQSQSGSLGNTGVSALVVTPNTSIAPTGTQWSFTVCPQAAPTPCYTQAFNVTGASQTVTVVPPPIRISLVNPNVTVRAYLDIEVINGNVGASYFNLTDTSFHVCSTITGGVCTYTQIAGGGGFAGSTDQIQLGIALNTGTYLTLPQGCVAYTQVSLGGPTLFQCRAADLSNGTTGNGFVVLNNIPNLTNPFFTSPSMSNATIGGGGSTTEIKMTSTGSTACDTPTAGVNFLCAGPNSILQFSADGNPYASPVIPMFSGSFSTTSATGAAVTGWTSGTIRAGQTVHFHCTGAWSIATAVATGGFGINASQTPQSIYYNLTISGNTTNGATGVKNATAASGTVTLFNNGSVNAINTLYPFSIDGSMVWNAVSSGTWNVVAATGNAADALTVNQGSACWYQVVN